MESISGLSPCFGRGDKEYLKQEKRVFSKLKKISGQKNVVAMQGSGSFSLEVVALNFLYGNILIVDTGYYSRRLRDIAEFSKLTHSKIKKIYLIDWKKISSFKGKLDWVWACATETSAGLRIPIKDLKKLSSSSGSKLALDATASIGLEADHKLADVISFSSCKGLMGLTGASFVCYKDKPKNKVNSFILNILNHKNKKMTGPYHTIQSLDGILKNYENMKKSIIINKKVFLKKFKNYLIYPEKNQPLLCTYVSKKITSKIKNVILYKARKKITGSIISHLGEAHLKNKAKGKIIKYLKINGS